MEAGNVEREREKYEDVSPPKGLTDMKLICFNCSENGFELLATVNQEENDFQEWVSCTNTLFCS